MVLSYPLTPHVRRHEPAGYLEYQSYKPWLRDEFAFRCVYCLLRECWFPPFGADLFSVDHLVPQYEAPERVSDYHNLVYACITCNACKSNLPVPDPCVTAYGEHLRVRPDGALEGLTPAGVLLIRTVQLNREPLLRYRQDLLTLLALAEAAPASETAARVRDLLSFPESLPDLTLLRPPAGNLKPEGIAHSAFARRQRGELPPTY